MKKYGLWVLISSLFFLTQCSQQWFEIGHENPGQEIKKCLALSQKRVYDKAVECLEIFRSRFPDSEWGQEAEIKIADTHFQQHQFLLAAESYQSFITLHPTHPKVDYAVYRMGLSYFREAPKSVDRDQKHLTMAIEQWNKLVRYFPMSDHLEATLVGLKDAEEKLARRLFYIGRFYLRTGEYKAAIPRLTELVEAHPNFGQRPLALYYLSRSHLALNQVEEARVALQTMIENYPNNSWTKKAQERYLAKVR